MISQRDKVFGCYMGAAVGDALGGPVQAMHHERIRKQCGGLRDMLHYRKPPGFFDLGPGYALQSDPGSVTDETLVRVQFADFVAEHEHSRNMGELVHHMLRYGDLEVWPPKMVEPLRQVQQGHARPEMFGLSFEPGGGLSWWSPFGIANLGHPKKASGEVQRLSALWKRPLEQDLLGATQAAVAHALTPKATPESTIEVARDAVGPLARALIDRAVDVVRSVPRGNVNMFVARLYECVLVETCPDGLEDTLPPPAPPPAKIDEPTASPLLAEQVPLVFAALAFGDGRSRATLLAAASLGRDAKAITSTVGSLIGALVGRSRLPREWVGAVIGANHERLDLVQQATRLADMVEPQIVL